MRKIPENQADCELILFEKFAELSECFSDIIKRDLEPERKCCVIQSMLNIYTTIYGLQ